MLRGQLKLEPVRHRSTRGDRILRDDAAIPFHFDFKIVAGQNRPAKVDNIGETSGFEAMLEIIRDIGLQDAGVAVAEDATAIDKLFRDMADFGNVKMRGDLFAVRQEETRLGGGMTAQQGFEFT